LYIAERPRQRDHAADIATVSMRWRSLSLRPDADPTPTLEAWTASLALTPKVRAATLARVRELAAAAGRTEGASLELGVTREREDGRGDVTYCTITLGTSGTALASAPDANGLCDDVRFHVDEVDGRSSWTFEAPLLAAEQRSPEMLAAEAAALAAALSDARSRAQAQSVELEEQRARAGEAAERADRDEAVIRQRGELLAVAAHDLRSPMGAAKSALELLEPLFPTLTEDQRHLLAVARRGCDFVIHLAGNLKSTALLDWTGLGAREGAESETTDLGAAVRDVLEQLEAPARQKGVALDLNLPEQRARVRGDATSARRIVENLVNNAIKYAPKQHGHVSVALSETPSEVVLAVEDDGVGVANDKLGVLFDALGRLRPRGTGGERGTGIGLYVSKRLVETMRGTIVARPRTPRGMRLEVRLPRG
jgi:signal transduction histidine kinase